MLTQFVVAVILMLFFTGISGIWLRCIYLEYAFHKARQWDFNPVQWLLPLLPVGAASVMGWCAWVFSVYTFKMI